MGFAASARELAGLPREQQLCGWREQLPSVPHLAWARSAQLNISQSFMNEHLLAHHFLLMLIDQFQAKEGKNDPVVCRDNHGPSSESYFNF